MQNVFILGACQLFYLTEAFDALPHTILNDTQEDRYRTGKKCIKQLQFLNVKSISFSFFPESQNVVYVKLCFPCVCPSSICVCVVIYILFLRPSILIPVISRHILVIYVCLKFHQIHSPLRVAGHCHAPLPSMTTCCFYANCSCISSKMSPMKLN